MILLYMLYKTVSNSFQKKKRKLNEQKIILYFLFPVFISYIKTRSLNKLSINKAA